MGAADVDVICKACKTVGTFIYALQLATQSLDFEIWRAWCVIKLLEWPSWMLECEIKLVAFVMTLVECAMHTLYTLRFFAMATYDCDIVTLRLLLVLLACW